jgi:hypothetical protein
VKIRLALYELLYQLDWDEVQTELASTSRAFAKRMVSSKASFALMIKGQHYELNAPTAFNADLLAGCGWP